MIRDLFTAARSKVLAKRRETGEGRTPVGRPGSLAAPPSTQRRAAPLFLAFFGLAATAFAQPNMGEPFVFRTDDGASMPYRLLAPPNVDQAGRQFPLIVFLHGAGERGTDNRIQMQLHIDGLRAATQTEEYASFLVAPQLPAGNTYWQPNYAYDLTLEIIDSLIADYPIDPSRIYVTGLSLGGNGSFNYISQLPDRFAAAVPLSGWGSSSASTAERIRDIPQWIFHGTSDSVIPVSESRNMFYAVDQVGGGSLYTEIWGGPHGIWAPIYSDWQTDQHGLYPWLFSQQLPAQPTVALISADSVWHYLDDGTDPGPAWMTLEFDDQQWLPGQGQFGYGDGDETTVVHCGPSAPTCRSDNFATVFFRQSFSIPELSWLESPAIELLRDDAAAVYVNGIEVFRDAGLPEDATFETYVRASVENLHAAIPLDEGLLREGINVIAVEVHQRSATDRDLSFHVRLTAQQVPEPGLCLPLLAAAGCVWWSRLRRIDRRREKTNRANPHISGRGLA